MLAHPGIEEAAAFIVSDPANGQRLTACIIAAPEQQLDTDTLLDTLVNLKILGILVAPGITGTSVSPNR